MSQIVPTQLEGSQTPNSLEILWEKNRRFIYFLLVLIAAVVGGQSVYGYLSQKKIDEEWGAFAANICLNEGYIPNPDETSTFVPLTLPLTASLPQELADADPAKLEAGLANADGTQKPFFLWALGYNAFRAGNYGKAGEWLGQLKSDYPNHVLCKESTYPVQYRKPKKPPKGEEANRNRRPEWEPAVAGTTVQGLQDQMARAQAYTPPPQFSKPEIPDSAPRVSIKFKDRGEVKIALMSEQAPKTVEKFLELVKDKFWDGQRVDEINRHGTAQLQRHQPLQMHFGYVTTKGQDDKTKWRDTEPSKHQIDFEENSLSHFPGAVCAVLEGDDKSSVDRIWISGSDMAEQDGERVVFGYVVEGLDLVVSICEAGLTTEQEERAGRGTPQDFIEIESVTLIEK